MEGEPFSFKKYFKMFEDYPKSIIIKTAVYLYGLRMTRRALEHESIRNANTARYWIFTHDRRRPSRDTMLMLPTLFQLLNIDGRKYGPWAQMSYNENSPYLIDIVDDKPMICEQFKPDEEPEPIVEIRYDPKPKYNSKKTSDGIPLPFIGSLLQNGIQLFCTVNRHCQLWDYGLQCKFCDLNATVKQMIEAGVRMPVYKKPQQVLEAVEASVQEAPGKFHYIMLSGGTIIDPVKSFGKTDTEFYLEFVKAITDRYGRRYSIQLQTIAKDLNDCIKLAEAGVTVHHANIEVWDPHLFKWICPGKEKLVGRDEWIRRVVKSVEVFGEGNVVPVFVQGVEMAQPYGFKTVDEAVKSNMEGWEYLIRNGVTPRWHIWTIEEGSEFRDQKPPPMEYYLRTSRMYYDLSRDYQLNPPRVHYAYGESSMTVTTQYDWYLIGGW